MNITESTASFYKDNPIVLPVYKFTHVLKADIKAVLSLKRLDVLTRTLCDSDTMFSELYQPYIREKTVSLALAEMIIRGHIQADEIVIKFERAEEKICH